MTGPHIFVHDGTTLRLSGEHIQVVRDGDRPRTLSPAEEQALPESVRAAVGAFWRRLRDAPRTTVEADQWRSTYRTHMDGWQYTWWEDRHDPGEGVLAEWVGQK